MPFSDVIRSILSDVLTRFREFSIGDALDILFIAFVMYKLIQIIRETKAGQLVKSILLFVLVFLLAGWLRMPVVTTIMSQIFQMGLIVIAVLFQPELRRAMERLGRSNVSSLSRMTGMQKDDRVVNCIDDVCKACREMQRSRTGALIVFERSTMLGEAISTGTILNSDVSEDIILNIFFPKTPLHDGAVIIRGGRIYAAGCILPLTNDPDLSRELGTRHRAAIGVTEDSDAIAVILSEETGTISVGISGRIMRDYNAVSLRKFLETELLTNDGDKKNILKKFKFLGKSDRQADSMSHNETAGKVKEVENHEKEV